MRKLVEAFEELRIQASADLKTFFILAYCFDKYNPCSKATREKNAETLPKLDEADRPSWFKYFEEDKDFYTIDQELDLSDEARKSVYAEILPALSLLLYEMVDFIPRIDEKNAHNIALGHPYAVWLYEYVDMLDACLAIASVCRDKSSKPILELLRLPELSIRFRSLVQPLMNGFCEKSIKELKEIRPEYLS